MQDQFLLLENVDRLLKISASQRGRDFAILLSRLSDLGSSVEWRVIANVKHYFLRRKVLDICRRLLSESKSSALRLR